MRRPVDDPIGELRPWHRFHVRITGLYAISVLAVLTLAAGFTWRWTVDLRLQALRSRLLDTAATVAWSVDPVMVQSARSGQADPSAMALHGRFSSLGALDPELRGIYVLKITEVPGQLAFVVDWSRVADDEALPGTLYDARALPVMRTGLERPVIGDAVNVASRLEQLASTYTTDVLVSGATVAALGPELRSRCIDQGEVEVKGRQQSVRVYSLSEGPWPPDTR